MKKTNLLVLAFATIALASCGGTTNPTENKTTSEAPAQTTTETPVKETAKLVNSYIGTFEGGYYIPAYQMVQPGYDNYVVDLYNDNTYVSNRVIYMNMYGTNGSVVITTTGSYALSENEDGDGIVSLSDAASILYTTCGMFNLQYSYHVQGMEDSTFPVSLMGSSAASDSLDFFKTEYGFGYSFLTTESNSLIKELYLPESYAAHFAKKDEDGNLLPREESVVVNPYKGEVKAHEFESNIKNVYIGTFEGGYYIPAYSMLQAGYDNYVVTTYADGTYTAVNVKYMNMYGTLGSVTLRTEGQYTTSENEDGDVIVSIKAADSILYTTSGMFNYQIAYKVGAMEDSLFPVALMGSSAASDSLDLFKSEYGYAYSFLTTESNSLVKELSLPEEIAARFVKEEPTEETTETTTEAPSEEVAQ